MHRSALALKLLTYEPTGAIVAAPTCSLPEGVGGERNWDYRYTWIRDSAFTVYAFLRLGFTHEAERFMHFIGTLCTKAREDGSLQIMYGIDGRKDLIEETLDHLDGYLGSKPVRVGNGAYDQLQLDIYGELLDSAYLFDKYGSPVSYDMWLSLRALVDWVCHNWTRTDEGVWEVRGGRQHFVYSKLMCWVALDRGIRLAQKRSLPADLPRWHTVRDTIHEEIMAKGWSEERRAFVQHYGSSAPAAWRRTHRAAGLAVAGGPANAYRTGIRTRPHRGPVLPRSQPKSARADQVSARQGGPEVARARDPWATAGHRSHGDCGL